MAVYFNKQSQDWHEKLRLLTFQEGKKNKKNKKLIIRKRFKLAIENL